MLAGVVNRCYTARTPSRLAGRVAGEEKEGSGLDGIALRGRRADCASDVVFVFPGQGTLQAGMGFDLYRTFSSVRDSVDAASARSGLQLSDLLRRGSAERLAAPDVAQIAVVALSIGLFRELQAAGVHPAGVAGHSAGEFSALVAAGVLDGEAAIDLVVARGRAMAAASLRHDGVMAAVTGLTPSTIEQLCVSEVAAGEVVIAAHNSPVQVVVSGERSAVACVLAAARKAGALRVDVLSLRGAFHSPLVAEAGTAMEPLFLDLTLRAPACPLVSSVTGAPVTDVEKYRAWLITQMTGPVRWSKAMHSLLQHGARLVVEVGASKVLGALARRHDPSLDVVSLVDARACARFLSGRSSTPVAGVST